MKKYFRKNVIIFIIFSVVLFAIGFYFAYTKRLSTQSYVSGSVKKGMLEEKLVVSGQIDASEKVTLRFQTSGKLSWVGVKEGDRVKKFQTVASLDKRDLKIRLDKYLNTYLKERNDFEQTVNDDYKDKVVTDSIKRILENSQYDLESAVYDVELQDLSLELANLWTPIQGLVVKIDAPFAGMNVTPATAEFQIINPDSVFFRASADQQDISLLKEGMAGELVLDSYPEEILTGEVDKVSFLPKAGETGAVYSLDLNFESDNSEYKYRIGMTGDLTFVTAKKEDSLYLPVKYIKNEQGEKFIYANIGGKKEKVPVKTGIESEGFIEITEGASEGLEVYD